MKRQLLLFTLCLPLLFGACGQQQAQMEYIGAEKAKALALTAAGFTSAQAEGFATDMSTRDGIDFYQVEFEVDGAGYRYDVDALTGVIIDAQVPQGKASESSHNSANRQESSKVPQADASAQIPQNDNSSSPDSEIITEEAARDIALEHAGLSAEQVTFLKSGLDRDNGRRHYDVEFYTGNYEEYDYNIDPYTGDILDFDYDAEYYVPPTAFTASPDDNSAQTITADEAKALALAQVPGATEGDIREFETDYDDGRMEYEGKIYYDHMEYEFEIDGYSGAIRNWDVESIYDD